MKTKHLALILIAVAVIGLRALSQDTEEKIPEDRTIVRLGTNGHVLRANGRY